MNELRLRLGVVAGEVSGDNLGAALIRSLRERVDHLEAYGMAGPAMIEAGCRALAHVDELSVMGLAEVLRSYPRLLRLRARLARAFIEDKPDVLVGIDVPDFNLGLERRVRSAGIPVAHWVCPQVWAWRPGRAKRLQSTVDRLLALFPFEQAFFESHGVPTSFVGHPLADRLPLEPAADTARETLGFDPDAELCALMPGSRSQEISRHIGVFRAAAGLVLESRPRMEFIICLAREAQRSGVGEMFRDLPVKIVIGQSHQALSAADVAMVTSGTVTLEALLCATPMVIAYRMSPLSYPIIRSMVNIPRIGLPNILSGHDLVPELIQADLTPAALAGAVLGWLNDSGRRADFRAESRQLHRSMRCDAAAKAAECVVDLVRTRG